MRTACLPVAQHPQHVLLLVVLLLVDSFSVAGKSYIKRWQVLTASMAVQTGNRGNQWIPNLPHNIKNAAQQVAMA